MWGRRRARREQEAQEAVEGLAASFRSTVEGADRSHEALLELREALAQELAEIAVLLGRRDGVPADAIRGQTDAAARVLADVDGMSERYTETRAHLVGKDLDDLGEIMPSLEELVEQAQEMAAAGEPFVEAIESVMELRRTTERLRDDLVPLRERIHAAHRAARDELAAAQGAPGWFGRQATLATLGDRLTALDEGRVTPTPEHNVTDHYRELEREIAELRDVLATDG
ncbi:hypothetical protein ACFV0T_19470 [Streptomyces sp. NPDC059582]|uniref:hypothetical protein n=1 Tax=Streptomyces sp. NPDC059582 TaxID=3346875 RepID=UPI0036BA164C